MESAEDAEKPGNKYDGASRLAVVQTSAIESVSDEGTGGGGTLLLDRLGPSNYCLSHKIYQEHPPPLQKKKK